MKIQAASYTIAILITVAVFANSVFLCSTLDRLSERLDAAPSDITAAELYEEIYSDYTKAERYISLTVSHSDLEGVDDSFAELLGAIEAEEQEALIVAKSRLLHALSHMRRLCGISIDSVF